MPTVKPDGVEAELSAPGRAIRSMVLALAGLAGAAAAAPIDEPPLIPDWKQSHLEEGNSAVRSVYMFAVCTRNHKREAAEKLLATAPGSAEETALVDVILPPGYTECPVLAARTTIRSTIFLRGALAEAMYNGDGTRPRAESPLPLAGTFQPAAGGSLATVASSVATCAVRRSPRLAHAVVSNNAGSQREYKALRALEPTLLACLAPGSRLRISRINFRAMIAEQLYRASLSFKESFTNAKG